jgi:mannose-6-phosphate isomerase-like protein (cupin superfamily)
MISISRASHSRRGCPPTRHTIDQARLYTLYFIISGTGANTVDGKTETRGPGSLIYEPHALVHQWGNPGDEPLIFLAFNINPEGVAAVLPGAPAKTQ